MDNSSVNIDLIRDHVDTIILATLANGDRYGLDILTEIKDNSKGMYELKQPTLYSCLKRLEKLGYITSYKGDTSNGAQRVYYSLLDDGRKILETDQYQWEYSRTIINNLLSNKDFNPDQEPPFNASDLRPKTKRMPKSEPAARDSAYIPQSQLVVQNLGEEEGYYAQEDENISVDNNNSQENQNLKLVNPELTTMIVPKDAVIYEQDVDYRNVLDNIFSSDNEFSPSEDIAYSKSNEEYTYTPYNTETSSEVTTLSFEYVEKAFKNKGFSFKPYYKKNTTEYYVNNYVYRNSILLYTTLVSYAIFALMLIVMHLATFKAYGTSASSLFITLGIMLLFPVIAFINWFTNSTKRFKANFDFKKTLSDISLMLISAFLLIIIIGFLGFNATFDNMSSVVKSVIFPSILLINIPIDIAVYSIFYTSKRFHVN